MKISFQVPSLQPFPIGISLRALDLNSNILGNTLPANIGNIFPDLILLDLYNNRLEGQVPVSLGNASGLQLVDLSFNSFSSQVPRIFGKTSGTKFSKLS